MNEFQCTKKRNFYLGILNGTAMGNVDTNILGGNETPYCFSSFWLCFCRADFLQAWHE
jgi:hypothetical protein